MYSADATPMSLREHAQSWRARGLGRSERRKSGPERARARHSAQRLAEAEAEIAAWRVLLGVGSKAKRAFASYKTLEAIVAVGVLRQGLNATKPHDAKVRAWPRTGAGMFACATCGSNVCA